MDNEHKSSMGKKSQEELSDLLNRMDKEAHPEMYRALTERLKELEQDELERDIPQREYASVLTRFGAILIDGLLLVPFYLPIYIVNRFTGEGQEPSVFFSIVILISVISLSVFGIWNTIVRMGKTGQSLGRKFLNIAVLNANGRPIGVGKALLREIPGRWISGLVCYLGYLNAFWDKDKQMWHDKIVKCYVYYVEEDFS